MQTNKSLHNQNRPSSASPSSPPTSSRSTRPPSCSRPPSRRARRARPRGSRSWTSWGATAAPRTGARALFAFAFAFALLFEGSRRAARRVLETANHIRIQTKSIDQKKRRAQHQICLCRHITTTAPSCLSTPTSSPTLRTRRPRRSSATSTSARAPRAASRGCAAAHA